MAIAIIVIVIVIAALAAGGGILLLRRRALRRQFGPEYDRLAAKVGERRALAELAERQRRIAQLDIRPLSAERRTAYDTQWAAIQEQFVDGPAQAAEAAGALVTAVAADRGYEVAEQERLLTDLSVYHADRLDGYRQARQATGQASTAQTEDLREAMLAYRALLRELLESPDGASQDLPDDADGTENGTRPEAGAGSRAVVDDPDAPEAAEAPEVSDAPGGPVDDRSAAQATRKE
jgi:hypothetical protein